MGKRERARWKSKWQWEEPFRVMGGGGHGAASGRGWHIVQCPEPGDSKCGPRAMAGIRGLPRGPVRPVSTPTTVQMKVWTSESQGGPAPADLVGGEGAGVGEPRSAR